VAPASRHAGLKVDSLVVGLGFVVMGVLWTLANLGQVDLLQTLRTWWPLWLVLWGTLELVNTALVRSGTTRPSSLTDSRPTVLDVDRGGPE
jgi:hypothetical protein